MEELGTKIKGIRCSNPDRPFWFESTFNVNVFVKDITESVLMYLVIPFLAGFLSRYFLKQSKGKEWYNREFVPQISPVALYAAPKYWNYPWM
jgi:ACR3 family arsenite efflux pump ArsB